MLSQFAASDANSSNSSSSSIASTMEDGVVVVSSVFFVSLVVACDVLMAAGAPCLNTFVPERVCVVDDVRTCLRAF